VWQAVAAQPFDLEKRHKAPRAVDDSIGEFWLENPFDFEKNKGFNLSMFERNRMFLNRDGKRFADVSFLSKTDLDSDSRAVAVGDLNGDGRPDLVVRSAGGGPLRVFLNKAAAAPYVRVTLQGSRSNKDGIGARLILTRGDRRLYREHFPQNSLYAQSALETIFGLGDYTGTLSLKIVWPSGREQIIENVQPGPLTVREPSE